MDQAKLLTYCTIAGTRELPRELLSPWRFVWDYHNGRAYVQLQDGPKGGRSDKWTGSWMAMSVMTDVLNAHIGEIREWAASSVLSLDGKKRKERVMSSWIHGYRCPWCGSFWPTSSGAERLHQDRAVCLGCGVMCSLDPKCDVAFRLVSCATWWKPWTWRRRAHEIKGVVAGDTFAHIAK